MKCANSRRKKELMKFGVVLLQTYTLISLVIKLCIADVQETQNIPGFQVVADLCLRIHHLTKNCLRAETLLQKLPFLP